MDIIQDIKDGLIVGWCPACKAFRYSWTSCACGCNEIQVKGTYQFDCGPSDENGWQGFMH